MAIPGRVSRIHGDRLEVQTTEGERQAYLSKKCQEPIAVGDWVALLDEHGDGLNRAWGPCSRRSLFSRKAAGETSEQVIAANMDAIWIVTSATLEWNPGRVERYLVAAEQSGVQTTLVMNKIDQCPDRKSFLHKARSRFPWVHIVPISALTGTGVQELESDLILGKTIVMVGSSGVGKTTLRNRLVQGEQSITQPIRDDDHQGRHTTTWREMVLSRSGGLIIDTPGMRELGLWESAAGFHAHFEDIESLAKKCAFRNCNHSSEPHCAVQQAIQAEELDPKRLQNYQKLEREQAYLESKADKKSSANSKRKWKSINKSIRAKNKMKA